MNKEAQAVIAASPQILTRFHGVLLIGLILCLGSLYGHAQTLDTVVFGNATSEAAHGLSTGFGPLTPNSVVAASGNAPYPSEPSLGAPSDVVTGAMGQTARRLLPRTPNPDIYGGETSFTMAVDPVKQNYITVKMWGIGLLQWHLVYPEYQWIGIGCPAWWKRGSGPGSSVCDLGRMGTQPIHLSNRGSSAPHHPRQNQCDDENSFDGLDVLLRFLRVFQPVSKADELSLYGALPRLHAFGHPGRYFRGGPRNSSGIHHTACIGK